jgi:3-oxoacyl-[acyl-carrier-protein] synthase II
VTGLGCISPLGGDVARTWESAVAGRSGIRAITRFDAAGLGYACRIAGEAPEALDLGDLPAKEARRLDRVIALALVAAAESVRQADLRPDGGERVGVAIGSGIGGIQVLQDAHRQLVAHGPRRVSPFLIPMTICNMSAGYVAMRHGLRGPIVCPVSACATGAQAIGEAARVIERGDADAMLAGGSEAAVVEIALAGFGAMRALSTRNDAPQAASRPFDRDRDGFVVGEGAAVLVLEALEHARARGARPLAEVLGYATTCDAAHVAQPREDAEGAARCMRLALADADLAPRDVDYLNAHATSTPAGDPAEARAVRAVFGADVADLAVSSTKSMTGHLLGAAGALEALLCVRALETGLLPPTVNLDHPDPECALDHVAHKARPVAARVALSNSFGFGGTNCSLILARADA